MATDSTNTVARPYAKAIFDIALAQNALNEWSKTLHYLAVVVELPDVRAYIETPGKTSEELVAFMQAVCGKDISESHFRLIEVLVDNKRLLVIDAISCLFDALKAEQEKTLDVDVISFDSLNDKQQQSLSESLKKRLNREVQLKVIVDKSILGGAVIHAGSLVIDGSVRSKLDALNIGLLDV